MADISGFGLVVQIVASNTFPTGFVISQLASDTDPLDMPNVRIGDLMLGLNGDPISWNRAVPLPVDISVLPSTPDDQNLMILARANRVGPNKASAQDEITMTFVFPDGTQQTFDGGKMVEAPTGRSIAGEGRTKTKTYRFMFAAEDGSV